MCVYTTAHNLVNFETWEMGMKSISDKRYIEICDEMRGFNSGDNEADHGNADDLLLKLLKELKMYALAELYDDVGKWYA